MYSTTSDKMNLHGRTGSHATKGSGRGTVWWNAPEEMDEPAAAEEYARLIAILEGAKSRDDKDMKRLVLPRIHELGKYRRFLRKAAVASRQQVVPSKRDQREARKASMRGISRT